MNLGESLRRNTLWILTGNVSGQLITFVVGVVLARLLAPEDFGLLVTINIFTGIASFVAAGGMGDALVQAKQVDEDDYRVVFTIQLIVCLLIYLGCYYIAPWLSSWLKNGLYMDLLRVAALTFLLRPFTNIPRARLKRAMQFKVIALSRLTGMIFGSSTSIVLALMDMGTWALIYGGLVGPVISTILLYYFTRWRPRIRFIPSVARRLGGYGIKMSLNAIILYLRQQTSNLIISHQLGPSLLGLFNKANSMSALPAQMISGSAYQTVFRALSSEQENLDRSKYIYTRTIALVAVYTLPFYTGLLWLAEPFIVTIYGSKWVGTALPLQILALSGLFRIISSPSGALIAAQNRLGHEIRIQIETWILLVIGCFIGLHWGIVGIAWGILPSFAYLALRLAWLANECVRGTFSELFHSLIPALLLNSALMGILLIVHTVLPSGTSSDRPAIYLLTMSGIGGAAYILLFLFAPIPALASESLRWKQKLRLSTGPA